MTATFRTRCETCDDTVVLDGRWLGLRHHTPDDSWAYWFRCPDCGLRDTKPVDEHLAAIMRRHGIPAVHWAWPAELTEPHTGPVITLDDLIDLMVDLETGADR